MLTVTSQIKDRFFDRQTVIEQIGRENVRRLGRMGAYVRQRARTDILRRGRRTRIQEPGRNKQNGRFTRGRSGRSSAASGRPPHVHSRDSVATLRNIQFGLGADDASVLIGPLALNGNKPQGSAAKTIPELLTKGGTARVPKYSFDNSVWYTGNYSQAPHQRSVTARYKPHPFMGPALDKEIAAGTVDRVWSASAF
ncbi:hypothetical protein [Aureliella helgolandensis]|uniref:Phage virion morphogenesis family protein n=1 Tax=Aureliella helgolandensis TaxID=2527968 RepID=A0A518G4R9_9BACT|nr:hypothetical protein [Aureliella helgolandensis]QDV23588.1 hypothetical protein Q31a_18900 [Aureliella helgolandensis]